jgi:sodium pump decarboxylase gamma subunit
MQFSLSAPVAMLGATDMTLPERISYAGTLTLLGMLVVFSVLAVVWLAIVLMRVILVTAEKTPKKENESAPASNPAPVQAQPVPNDDGALLAAITAAIAVVWESEHPGTGFRVVSYRHVGSRKPWNSK